MSDSGSNVEGRVLSLEKKIQQQDDEIVCLKSALSDALRRIATLETSHKSVSALPNKPTVKTTPSRQQQQQPAHHAVPESPRTSATRRSNTSLANPPPTPTNASSHATAGSSKPRTPRLSASDADQVISKKEPTHNAADGSVRFVLRGRGLNFYPPTNSDQLGVTSQPLKHKLQLEWVYGYRGRDARCNVYQLPTGEVVYFVAGVVVLYNVEEQTQRHYLGHTDDVKCMAVHPDKVTIATGQVAGHDKVEGKCHVRVWNSISLNTLKVVGLGQFDRAIACLAFSVLDGGQQLAVVDESNEHLLSVWDWMKGDKGHKLTEAKSSTEAVVCVQFNPCLANSIVTCGKSHLMFWTLEAGTLSRKSAIYEKHEKPKFVTCVAFTQNGDVLSGDSNGSLFVWSSGSNKVSTAVVAIHEGGTLCLSMLKDGSLLTGGKDRRVVEWATGSYSKTGREIQLPEEYGGVRTISQAQGNSLLIGTTKNFILHGSLDLNFTPIVQGHCDELWGLRVLPGAMQFVSVGYDKLLCLWDALTHHIVSSSALPDGGQCVCVHPDGAVLIVSCVSSGRWLVVDATSREVIESHSDAAERIDCIQFSPDGRWLACGSRDNNIYIYSVNDSERKYTRVAKCTGHSSFVLHLDWSVDSQYLQSNSGDYELLFWSSSTWRQVTVSSQLRDVQWATQNCTLAYAVSGIWAEGADGTDINACTRSHQQQLLASADDFGKVNLYSYPCTTKGVGESYHGHSSHVTNVEFVADDSRLLSTGGKDCAVFQWQVVATDQ